MLLFVRVNPVTRLNRAPQIKVVGLFVLVLKTRYDDELRFSETRVNLTGCNVFQLRQLTPDLLFHSGPAVFLTV